MAGGAAGSGGWTRGDCPARTVGMGRAAPDGIGTAAPATGLSGNGPNPAAVVGESGSFREGGGAALGLPVGACAETVEAAGFAADSAAGTTSAAGTADTAGNAGTAALNAEAGVQAQAADKVRQQLERMQNDYNYILAKKYAYPSAVHVVDEVTRVLPDDTWITQLELKAS
ncbi:MAG: hypothetical protein E6H53_15585, partial [Betaproteobacteria bacterium]